MGDDDHLASGYMLIVVFFLYTYMFAFFFLLVNIGCYASKMILCCFEYT